MRRAIALVIFSACVVALALFAHAAKTPRERKPKNPELITGDVAVATTNPSTNPTTGPTTSRVATSGPSSKPATSAPSTSTTTQASANRPFPKEFSSLLTRSLFTRGAPPSGKLGGEGPPGGPEANLGLRGVLVLDGKFTAIVEDVAQKKAQQYKAGDSVGPGKVKAITIDSMEYQNGPTSRTVAIGQNLLGMPLPPQPPPQPKQPQAQPGQPQPGQPGGPPQPGQIPPEVMKQMRRGR